LQLEMCNEVATGTQAVRPIANCKVQIANWNPPRPRVARIHSTRNGTELAVNMRRMEGRVP